MILDFTGHSFESTLILLNVKWYLSYPLSYRNLEEMMDDRGVNVDHTTIYRWVMKFSGSIEKTVRKLKGPTAGRWKLDETYIKVKGVWTYLYRAVDSHGDTIDFYLSQRRDTGAAKRFLRKAIRYNGTPEKVNIDKSGANKSALDSYNSEHDAQIEIRQSKYMNNMVEQDHRQVKRHHRFAQGYKSTRTARRTIAGIEALHMLRKGQVQGFCDTPAQTFWVLFET